MRKGGDNTSELSKKVKKWTKTVSPHDDMVMVFNDGKQKERKKTPVRTEPPKSLNGPARHDLLVKAGLLGDKAWGDYPIRVAKWDTNEVYVRVKAIVKKKGSKKSEDVRFVTALYINDKPALIEKKKVTEETGASRAPSPPSRRNTVILL